MSDDSFRAPWEEPAVQTIVNIFNGSVTKVTPLNEIQGSVGGDTDGNEIYR